MSPELKSGSERYSDFRETSFINTLNNLLSKGCIRERRPDLKFGKIAKVVGICWKKKLEKDPEMKKVNSDFSFFSLALFNILVFTFSCKYIKDFH